MRDTAYVVVLNWNGRDYVRECLRSLFAQTHEEMRVIVVDNASTDESPDIVRQEFPEADLVSLPENLHFARGTNAGIEKALGHADCAYVVTLNNDTRADQEWLEQLLRPARHERVGCVGTKLVFMDRPKIINSTGLVIARDGSGWDRGWLQVDEGQFDEAVDVFGVSAGAALYRREMFDDVGLFDGDFVAYYEDLDLAWRARLAGWTARFAPRSVVFHKYSASSDPRALWKTYQGERNRIWNLIQNYPWRHVLAGMPWNATKNLAAMSRRTFARGHGQESQGPLLRDYIKAVLRARLDAYAGLPRALEKRRARASMRKVDAKTVGTWLRIYGAGLHDVPAE